MPAIRTVFAAFLTFIPAAGAQDANAPAKLPTAQEISSVLNELSQITGFQVKRQLPFAMVTRDQVNAFLRQQIRHSVKPREIRAEEVTLKKFGFVPRDFDLRKTTIDLLTEQAAAYYDFHRRKLFISDWAAENMRDTAIVHELAHALADQNVSIQKFLGKASDNSEESLARESVVEGQASWLMIEVAARRIGRTLANAETAAEYLKDPVESDDAEYPVFSKAPLYVKRTLMFPYDAGEKFQQALVLKDGKEAFMEAFRNPPVSTAQVLHPAAYFAHVTFVNPDLPKPAPRTSAFVKGTLGELDQRVLLKQYIDADAAATLSPRLKGASYRIDEAKTDHRMMLVYAADWQDAGTAGQYFDAYRKILRAKWKNIEVTADAADRFAGRSEDGYFEVTLKGTLVLSREGFAEPL